MGEQILFQEQAQGIRPRWKLKDRNDRRVGGDGDGAGAKLDRNRKTTHEITGHYLADLSI